MHSTWLRLFLILLAASVLPIAGAGFVVSGWLEDTARADARVRMASLAELGAALVRQRVAQAEASLATTGRVIGAGLEDRVAVLRDGARSPVFDVESMLAQALGEPSPFLDVQLYAVAERTELFAQNVSPDLALAQRRAPDLPAYQNAQAVSNIGSPAVQVPLLENGVWRSETVERDFGFPTVRLSAPSSVHGQPNGAVVGYLDLRALPEDLQPIADAGCAAALSDRDGASLGAVDPSGAVDGPTEHVSRAVGFGGWTLEVRMPVESIVAAAAGARWRALGWTAAAGMLAVAASLLIAWRISRPLARLTAAADAMTAGRLEARSGVGARDEFGRLGTAFDRMARSLEDLDRARSSFVATVSHELRTPLTSIQLTLDNVRDGIAGPVPEAISPSIERVRGDCTRLLALVDDLLQTTRIDAGVEQASPQPIDLAMAAREVVDTLAPLAARTGKSLTLAEPAAGRAAADPQLLRRILTNLCDNGIRHSTAGGAVEVFVDESQVAVENDGGGLDPDRHRAAFARGSDGPGTGLGLFLVERLAALQGGRVAYTELPGPRTRVTLHLPPADA